MPSTKGNTNARIHTARNDSDGGAAARRGTCPYWKASAEACACDGACYYAEAEKAERKTAAGHESVDGVHPRKARQEA